MTTSVNGWPALGGTSSKLHYWVIPAANGRFKIRLRNGSAGFLLAHFLLWFSEVIEDVTGKVLDDWGWAPPRPVRGQITGLSNHCSGTAWDVNALKHVLGRRGTFKTWQYVKIRAKLLMYAGCIRHGIDYKNRPDEMHAEINRSLPVVEKVAKRLMNTYRGKRILEANPSQRKVILS